MSKDVSKEIKRKVGPDNSGLFIPIGIFFGLAAGLFLGGKLVPVCLFIGLGSGFVLMAGSSKRRHRKIIKLQELEEKKQKAEEELLLKQTKQAALPGTKEEEIPTYLESTLQNYKELLTKIQALTKRLPNEKQKTVVEITYLLEKIYEYVLQDVSRYSTVKVFFQTYIGSLENIMQTYVMLLDQPVKNEEAVESIKNIEKLLLEMKTEFEESYVKLYEKDVMSVNLEMEMLRKKFEEEKAPRLF